MENKIEKIDSIKTLLHNIEQLYTRKGQLLQLQENLDKTTPARVIEAMFPYEGGDETYLFQLKNIKELILLELKELDKFLFELQELLCKEFYDEPDHKNIQPKKDVHTEHCCRYCGCKYGDSDCPVVARTKTQSFPCIGVCLS